MTHRRLAVWLAVVAAIPALLHAQAADPVRQQIQRERSAFLDTLKELVEIESGTSDVEGVTRIGNVIADKLRALGGEVERVPPPPNMLRFSNTPDRLGDAIVARFRGRGTARILLMAHMDTVYQRGMLAQQPFRVDGDRAYGLGIADDKQGVALILHAVATLRSTGFANYGLITVFINSSEEVASVSTRDLIATLGAEHDIALSYEGGGAPEKPALRLTTTGIENAILTVKGRASHAGVAPEQGRNAFYEMAHQVLQMRDLSDPSKALKVNWTIASAGAVFNQIPANARAVADMRANDPRDFGAVEAEMQRRIRNTLIPDTVSELKFERIFPPLPLREQSQRTAAYAQRLAADAGSTIAVLTEANGGGTDAAFAASKTNAPVIEGFGLPGGGSHSSDAEFVMASAIESRLYLTVRLVMDVADGKVPLARR